MKKNILVALILILSCTQPKEKLKSPEWIQLFNGEDLAGWTIKISGYPINNNYKNTFIVEDGLLKVNYSEYKHFNSEFGHIFYKDKFSHYKLRVEYRFVGQQVRGGPDWAFKNSGAMLHAQAAESMGLNQNFPVSIEVQFLGGEAKGERPTANLCTPGTNVIYDGSLLKQHCIDSRSKTFRGEEWVTVEMVVLRDSIIHHLVNGDTVLTYGKPQIDGTDLPQDFPLTDGTALKDGFIAFQAESHPIEFRKIELLNYGK